VATGKQLTILPLQRAPTDLILVVRRSA